MTSLNLTEEQQKIATHRGDHARVSAVAGSGKTTTMVARIKYLLEQGADPRHILVLMFNRSARDSFASKMNFVLAQAKLPMPEVRTFHSLGLRLVGSFTRQGHLPAFTLVTEDFRLEKMAKEAVRHVIEQNNGKEEWLSRENLESFINFIDLVKSDTKTVEDTFECLQLSENVDYFIEAFNVFEDSRKYQKTRFYSDLIYDPIMAIRRNQKLADWVSDNVDHIIVDEYQDINEVQQQLLKIIAGKRAKVMVVGDVDQCIYEWRGAKPEYITERFLHDFPKATSYTLSYTFRYGHRLSLAANHVIANNKTRDRKLCLSSPANHDTKLHCLVEKGLHPILSILEDWTSKRKSLTEAAVLVRMFAMSVPVELALLDRAIPYRLVGHEHVFSCPEIKALTGYLHLCHGSLAGLDEETAQDTIEAMLTNPSLGVKRENINTLAQKIAGQTDLAPELILSAISSDMPVFLQRRFEETAQTWREIINLPSSCLASLILETVIRKTELFSFYKKISTRAATAENRIKTCQAYVHFAANTDLNVEAFLEKIKSLQSQRHSSDTESLLITSIHRAKGLEWPMVIIAGLTDGSFPLTEGETALSDDIEDERRLFYVAMTRAKEKVFFIHPPDNRFMDLMGKGICKYPRMADKTDTFPASRFLYEANIDLSDRLGRAISEQKYERIKKIDAHDIHLANSYLKAIGSYVKLGKGKEAAMTTDAANTEFLTINDLGQGMVVNHVIFGKGVVSAIMNRRQGKIRVSFDNHGEKSLVLPIAKLQAWDSIRR